MKLYDYLLLMEYGDELTVWDKEYDVEIYFYNDFDIEDSWSNSMMELSKLLTIDTIHPNGVTVNLSEIIENNIEELKKSNLFIRCNIDSIMYDIDNIISGNVSEKWMEKFVSILKRRK